MVNREGLEKYALEKRDELFKSYTQVVFKDTIANKVILDTVADESLNIDNGAVIRYAERVVSNVLEDKVTNENSPVYRLLSDETAQESVTPKRLGESLAYIAAEHVSKEADLRYEMAQEAIKSGVDNGSTHEDIADKIDGIFAKEGFSTAALARSYEDETNNTLAFEKDSIVEDVKAAITKDIKESAEKNKILAVAEVEIRKAAKDAGVDIKEGVKAAAAEESEKDATTDDAGTEEPAGEEPTDNEEVDTKLTENDTTPEEDDGEESAEESEEDATTDDEGISDEVTEESLFPLTPIKASQIEVDATDYAAHIARENLSVSKIQGRINILKRESSNEALDEDIKKPIESKISKMEKSLELAKLAQEAFMDLAITPTNVIGKDHEAVEVGKVIQEYISSESDLSYVKNSKLDNPYRSALVNSVGNRILSSLEGEDFQAVKSKVGAAKEVVLELEASTEDVDASKLGKTMAILRTDIVNVRSYVKPEEFNQSMYDLAKGNGKTFIDLDKVVDSAIARCEIELGRELTKDEKKFLDVTISSESGPVGTKNLYETFATSITKELIAYSTESFDRINFDSVALQAKAYMSTTLVMESLGIIDEDDIDDIVFALDK